MTTFELNLVDYVPDEQLSGGVTMSPFRKKEDGMSYGKALLQGTLPWQLGARLREFVDRDTTKDPNYKPFDAWKEDGADESKLEAYMDTENLTELGVLRGQFDEIAQRRRVIEESGFAGQAANFIADVATDPTTYLGFGSAMMLKNGFGLMKAGAISGGLAGASTATLREVGSPQEMSLDQGAAITVASTVLGGVLGKAVDTFANLQSKGIVKKDFDVMATQALSGADNLAKATASPQSVGAAVSPSAELINTSIDGRVGRFIAKAASPIVPKLWFQEAKSLYTKTFGARFFGTEGRTIANKEGVASPSATVAQETQKLRNQATVRINDALSDKVLAKTFGRKATEEDFQTVTRALFDDGADVTKLSDLQRHIYDFNKKYYEDYAEVMGGENVAFFNERKWYGHPVIFSKEKVAKNIDDFRGRIFANMKKVRDEAEVKITELQAKIKEIQAKIDNEPDPRYNAGFRRALENRSNDLEYYKEITRATDDSLMDDASLAADKMASGIFYDEMLLSKEVVANKSRFFKERTIDPLDFIDYLEVNPTILAAKYTDSVAPHIAFRRAFPEYKDFNEFLDDAKQRIMDDESIPFAERADEAKEAIKRITLGWEQETGTSIARSIERLGKAAPYVSAVNNLMYLTQMGGQVLAGLVEPLFVTVHHGLVKGGAHFGKAAIAMATDPLVRQAAKKEMGYLGIGYEVAASDEMLSRIGYEAMDREVSSGLAQGTRKAALMMSKANLSVFWDTATRRAIGVAQSGILKENLFKYEKLSGDLKADLAYMGIDKKNIGIIRDQLKEHGSDINGIFFANPEKWTNKKAAQIWINAIRKDNRRTSIQADLGDVPFVFRTPIGQLAFKYRTWSVASTSKMLIPLAQHPAKSAAGVATMVSMGTLVQTLQDMSMGREISTDPDELLYGGIVKSGAGGILPEAGLSLIMNKAFGTQAGGGRLYEYSDVPTFMAGPTGQFLKDVGTLTSAALPKYNKDNQEYNFGFVGQDGNIKDGVINAFVDLIPLPFKQFAKEPLKDLVNE